MKEVERIAEQLRRAWEGEAWHGPALRQILSGLSANGALERPIRSVHTIWEIVLHITAWEKVAAEALRGTPVNVTDAEDWPVVTSNEDKDWETTVQALEAGNGRLRQLILQFAEERLNETVPGKQYSFYILLHGMIQHDLFHAGQISLLKKAMTP